MQQITDNIYVLVVLGMAGATLLVAGFIIIQIRSQNRLLMQRRKLQNAEIQYGKELLNAVITSQETEQRRIGMDLHDEVGSALSSLRLLIENNIPEETTGQPDNFKLKYKADIDRIINNVRNISHNLSPRLDGNFGLYDAIFDLAEEINYSGRVNMAVDFDEARAGIAIENNKALAIYRIIRELVNNTIKHAEAKTIQLGVNISNDTLLLEYYDDGKGLDNHEQQKGMGLKNIESRIKILNATHSLSLNNATGYKMSLNIPLKNNDG